MNGTIKEKIYTFYNIPCLYDKEEKNYKHGDIKKKKKEHEQKLEKSWKSRGKPLK